MENYDILIKNCQVLNPDMSVSSTCSVGIKDTWIKKIGSADEFADIFGTASREDVRQSFIAAQQQCEEKYQFYDKT